jgi:hypothetical protein
LYGHGKFAQSAVGTVALLAAVLVVAFAIDSLAQPSWRVAFATRRWQLLLGLPVVQLVVHVSVLLTLISSLSLLAVPVATAAGLAVQDLLLTYYVSRWVGGLIDGALLGKLLVLALAFAPLFGLMSLASLVSSPEWRWILIVFGLGLGVTAAISLLARARFPEGEIALSALRTAWRKVSDITP